MKDFAGLCSLISEYLVYRICVTMLRLSFDQLALVEKSLLELREANRSDYIHKMLAAVRTARKGLTERSFYVDHYPEFSALVSIVQDNFGQKQNSPMLFLKSIVDSYGTCGEKVLNLLLQIDEIQWNEFFIICSSSAFVKELESLADIKPVHIRMRINPVLEAKVDDIPKFTLPQGYHITSLTEADTPEVNSSWTYSGEGTEALINWLIKNFTSVAVRTDAGILVGYMLEQEMGSLGMLHVHPDHRRKGLGQLIVSELAHKVKKPGETVYVFTDNEASDRLHEKCGFKKIFDSLWVLVIPKQTAVTPTIGKHFQM